MDQVIYLEKVRRPVARGLLRERLDRQLVRARAVPGPAWAGDPGTPSLGLVLGPPGSGKTTLLSQVAAASPEPAAWYRAGAEDETEIALVRHLGHTMGAALGRPDIVASAASGQVGALVAVLDQPASRPGAAGASTTCTRSRGSRAELALERFLGCGRARSA